ncbi:MAG: hypothetical protein ACPHDL_00005, partial [Limisphaerales bacterium]
DGLHPVASNKKAKNTTGTRSTQCPMGNNVLPRLQAVRSTWMGASVGESNMSLMRKALTMRQ